MEKVYSKRKLDQISYPLGGIGAGMVCLQGNGMISGVSLQHCLDLYNEPNMFAAVTVKGNKNISRVLEGQIPITKYYCSHPHGLLGAGAGLLGKNYGLPRFSDCEFSARFPFAHISLSDEMIPLNVEIEGYSPFIPGNADDSSLPVASIGYTFKNNTDEDIEAIFYYSYITPLRREGLEKSININRLSNGFVIEPQEIDNRLCNEYAFAVTTDSKAYINTDFYRGDSFWWDNLTLRWKNIEEGNLSDHHAADLKSPGGAIEIPFAVKAHSSHNISIRFCWYVPNSDLCMGPLLEGQERATYKPWYTVRYSSISDVVDDFTNRYTDMYKQTKKFSDTLYASDIPDIIIDAIGSNLTILKSPTVLRQEDGRFWGWEGSFDNRGSCHGSCTHVWNYAQALCHLFPILERTMRETEFCEDMDEYGHQQFRTSLPIRRNSHDYFAASDGQAGGIMKMYREWRISGDTEWIYSYWDKMVASMEYCIHTWDKKEEGVLREPHHNTYDIEFWGADGMCSSYYLGALKAIAEIGKALGKDIKRYETLYEKGREYLETVLWNGEYFIQIPEWKTLDAEFNANNDPILISEGPKYQYGTGCLSDGICGAWLAKECGLGDILDVEKMKSHLLSVYKYNLKKDLYCHSNPQRSNYAIGNEGGLLLCSWPKGGKPTFPFVYSDEVWTGIEYQVAAHLASFGYFEEALDIITTLRERYDGEKRNPYSEYECGYWYARAMSSYAMLHAYTGVRYDAVTKTLYAKNGEYKVFLATATGYGLVSCSKGSVQLDIVSGIIEVENIEII